MTDLPAAHRFGSAAPLAAVPEPPAVAFPGEAVPPRRRPRWLAPAAGLLALLLLAGGWLGGRLTAPPGGHPELVLTRAVPAGSPVTAAEVRAVRVDRAGAAAVTSLAALRGLVARVSLEPGRPLTRDLFAAPGAVPSSGSAEVGLALAPGQGPADGLVPGDVVALVLVPRQDTGQASGAPVVLVPDARVVAAAWGRNGTQQVSVVVDAQYATVLAGASAEGRVAAVRLPPGTA